MPEWNDTSFADNDFDDFGLSSLPSKPSVSSFSNNSTIKDKQSNSNFKTNDVHKNTFTHSSNLSLQHDTIPDQLKTSSHSSSQHDTFPVQLKASNQLSSQHDTISDQLKTSNHSSSQHDTLPDQLKTSNQLPSSTNQNFFINSNNSTSNHNSFSTNHVSDTPEHPVNQFSNSLNYDYVDIDNDDDDDEENLTESQSNIRKIPGPAGALPPLKQGEKIRNDHEINDNENKYQDPTLVLGISSQFIRTSEKKMKKVIEDEVDFRQPSWASMLMDMDLPPFGHSKLNYSLWWVHEIGYKKKVPKLIVLVKSLKTAGDDYQCTLRDPTGEYDYNTIHRGTIEMYPNITQGCVLELKDVPVFTPRNNNHYLIITPKNINRVWPKNINIPYENLKKMDPRKNDLTSIYDESCLKNQEE